MAKQMPPEPPDPGYELRVDLSDHIDSAAQGHINSTDLHTCGDSAPAAYTRKHSGWPFTDENFVGEFIELPRAEHERLLSVLDDLCDWAQHVAAPEDDAIHSIVERAEEALRRV